MKKRRTIISDIDGTLTNYFSDVVKLYNNKDYDLFAEACLKLPPRDLVIQKLIDAASWDDTLLVFMTGRSKKYLTQTSEFLAKNFSGCRYELLMREFGDFRPSVALKRQWTRGLIRNGHEIICAYDDRHDICKMFGDEFLINTVQVGLDFFGGDQDE